MVAAKPTKHTPSHSSAQSSRSPSQSSSRSASTNVQPNMQQPPKRTRAGIPADMPDDLSELALTEPRLTAIHLTPPPSSPPPPPPPTTTASPPPPPIPIGGAALSAAVNFAAYVSVRAWMTTTRLSRLSLDQRMRLFLLMGRVYFPALELAARDHPEYQPGRMSGPLLLP